TAGINPDLTLIDDRLLVPVNEFHRVFNGNDVPAGIAAALIDHRNRNASGHIITIEDPVEFIHRHKKSIVNQR
ncbi:hypothetical protein QCD79_32965, partial [Pseudomonas quasicaspiana]|nr:hypothetical protein [Pseudomonas quasicaspiana]